MASKPPGICSIRAWIIMRSASLDASAPRVSRSAILGVATAKRQRVFPRKDRQKGGDNSEMMVNHTIHDKGINVWVQMMINKTYHKWMARHGQLNLENMFSGTETLSSHGHCHIGPCIALLQNASRCAQKKALRVPVA